MNKKFNSPDEFRDYCLTIYEKNIKRKQKPSEFIKLSERSTDVTWDELSDYRLINIVVTDRIMPSLQDKHRADIESKLSFGVLNNPEINAKVIKYKYDQIYTILLYNGLLSYLILFLRLSFAIMNPRAVIYCPDVDINTATSDTYKKMLDLVISAYLSTGIPLGFLIHLEDDCHSAIAQCYLKMLIFLVGHEIGHFINGDFADDGNSSECPFDDKVMEYRDLTEEASQKAADMFGYQTLRATTNKFDDNQYAEAHDLECITALFSAFSNTAKTRIESYQYGERFLCITRNYYKNKLPAGYSETTINNWRREVYGIHIV